ncbi:MAG: hypothetical protein A2Y07_04015 [Planctomycetes bacterium GWF2_50_10]|nr:MAG: hypothetical protein A2Y07_04015 [Planctomycetes bacterium GWF2_50_10]
MIAKRNNKISGITIIELMIGMVISLIVILAIGQIIADGVKGFENAYIKANGPVVSSSYVAQKRFDRIVRKASYRASRPPVAANNTLDIYYISDPSAYTALDRRVRFYISNGNLLATEYHYRPPNAETTLTTETICSNVSACEFKTNTNDRSAQMILRLTDGSSTITTVASAYMHN